MHSVHEDKKAFGVQQPLSALQILTRVPSLSSDVAGDSVARDSLSLAEKAAAHNWLPLRSESVQANERGGA